MNTLSFNIAAIKEICPELLTAFNISEDLKIKMTKHLINIQKQKNDFIFN